MAWVFPSITYWNRVEPTPRADSLVRGLEAAVRDPLWFLTRQWQMGEFRGEDAASPAYVSFAARFSRFESWRSGDGDFQPIDGSAPLEVLVETEPATPNWRTSVELGQALARELRRVGASNEAIDAFRAAYPVPRPADLTTEERRDSALVAFLRICGGRSIDGATALRQVEGAAPHTPAEVTIPAGEEGAVETALRAWAERARATWGEIGREDAPGWRPERLDYDVEVQTATPDGGNDRLRGHAGGHGEFDWYSFDVIERARPDTAPTTREIRTSLFPTGVSFAGMPHSRWWQLEDARFNWANLDADRRELAKTLVLDFMLVQGNDWFLVPFGQEVGSLVGIDQLTVRDVFGELTLIERADAGAATGRDRWSLFSTVVDGATERLADYFILPPSVLRATIDGPTLEEVRFLRDEQANMVWAVEATTENGIGRPWDGRERALEVPDDTPPPPDTEAPIRYRLQTTVPVNWIPFVPVQIDDTRRAVALERAAMQRYMDGALTRVRPVGRVLNPTNVEDPVIYRVREEEVERTGTRVLRAVRRARWLDGSTHVWVSRQRRVGMGEGVSGLKYDIAEPVSS